jgi:hypothetical protein
LSARLSSAREKAQLKAPRFLPSIITSGVSLSSATAPTKVTVLKSVSESLANSSGAGVSWSSVIAGKLPLRNLTPVALALRSMPPE